VKLRVRINDDCVGLLTTIIVEGFRYTGMEIVKLFVKCF